MKENTILIENKKPIETVYELKNEVPSFEEFMKVYEDDGSLNYDDLISSNIGTQKGYGPCISCHSSQPSHNKVFKLNIELENWIGGFITKTVYNTYDASIAARDIENRSGYWSGGITTGRFDEGNRNGLAGKIREAINCHNSGRDINESINSLTGSSLLMRVADLGATVSAAIDANKKRK